MGLDPELLKQLIETFKAELHEQVQLITDGLLALEKKDIANKDETVKSIFRAAHNIKGSARSLGVHNVADIAHHIETIFAGIQKNILPVTPSMIDTCLNAIDKLELALNAFAENKPLDFDIKQIITKLIRQGVVDEAEEPSEITIENEIKIDEKSSKKEVKQENSIRVSIANLNHISSTLEEIQAIKIGIDDHYMDISKVDANLKNVLTLFRQNIMLFKQGVMGEAWHKWSVNSLDLLTSTKEMTHLLTRDLRSKINDLSILTNSLQDEIRLLQLVPSSRLLMTFPRYVRDLSRQLNKNVELKIIGDDVKVDKLVLENLKDPIMHILRNALDHGIETIDERIKKGKPEKGFITITISEESGYINIMISDDGAGINPEKIKRAAFAKNLITENEFKNLSDADAQDLIFMSGMSTKDNITDLSGRGVGLDIVRSNLVNINGKVTIKSIPNEGTTIYLQVPLTLASERGLLVKTAQHYFVVPTRAVEKVMTIKTNEIYEVGGSPVISIDNNVIELRALATMLKLPDEHVWQNKTISAFLIRNNRDLIAILVDEILGEREIVLKPLQPPLHNIPSISGGTLSGKNQILLVLNPNDLFRLITGVNIRFKSQLQTDLKKNVEKPHILVVDDSITTRTLEKNVLESHHYQVTTAVNGKEAWELLTTRHFALLITDVNMPIMDGLALTQKIKQDPKLEHLPVIIVTSLGSEEEKKKGIEVGADAYVVKSEFESGALLDIVSQLV